MTARKATAPPLVAVGADAKDDLGRSPSQIDHVAENRKAAFYRGRGDDFGMSGDAQCWGRI